MWLRKKRICPHARVLDFFLIISFRLFNCKLEKRVKSVVAMLVGEYCVMWLVSAFIRYHNLTWFFAFAEIHHLVYEQDGATVPGTATQSPAIDGVRQTRSTSKHKQRNHEATSQGTEHNSLQATKKKSGHIKKTLRRVEETEVARCELLVIRMRKEKESSKAKSRISEEL